MASHGVSDGNCASASGERGNGAGARCNSRRANRTCGGGVSASDGREDLGRDSGDWCDGHSVRVADLVGACNDVCDNNSGGSGGESCDGAGAGSDSSCTNWAGCRCVGRSLGGHRYTRSSGSSDCCGTETGRRS